MPPTVMKSLATPSSGLSGPLSPTAPVAGAGAPAPAPEAVGPDGARVVVVVRQRAAEHQRGHHAQGHEDDGDPFANGSATHTGILPRAVEWLPRLPISNLRISSAGVHRLGDRRDLALRGGAVDEEHVGPGREHR